MLNAFHLVAASGPWRFLPLAFLVCALLSISVCLGSASSSSGQDMSNWPNSPPISALAESDASFPLFASGFTLLSTFLGGDLLFRAASIGASSHSSGQRIANFVWLIPGLSSIPFILLMAYNRDDGPNSDLHFLGAFVGMGLICLSGIIHAGFCLCMFHADRGLPRVVRTTFYSFQAICFCGAIAAFGSWFVSDKSTSTMEWVGFILAMCAYASYAIYFVPSSQAQATSENQPLLG